ncbi:MAG: type II secretion system GspH family protein [Candidatus Omnitrophica bacterium]|nr:type II secretion system GspH family protein [Candidatus Omnitrophota bacterium]
MHIQKNQGFTIIELLVVVTLIGLIAAFTIPDYTKTVAKSHERDLILQATTVHGANMIYQAQNGTYWVAANESNLGTINSSLNISLMAQSSATFNYNSDGSTFTFDGSWGGFTVRVTQAALSGANPSCGGGTCPSL